MPSESDNNTELTTARASARLAAVLKRIRSAEQQYNRPPGSVELLAVSKTKPIADIAAVAAAGHYRFGENYLQEALTKISALQKQSFQQPLEWHFIGPIQSNKTRAIAEHFAWVHSIDRLKIAERLSAQRPSDLPALNVCLQVNIDNEVSKSGFVVEELSAIAAVVAKLPRLRLRGLMAIPAPHDEFDLQRLPFARLRAAQQALQASDLPDLQLDTLSMGMSADLEAAIAEGATQVRVGTALFGPRS